MQIYETTFVVNPQTDDSSIDREVKSVSDLITGNGGKMLHEDRIGTRRLAYELKGLSQGYYTTLIYEAPKQVLPQLDRHFKLGEAYLRHLTVICERDIKKITQPEEATTGTEEKVKKSPVAKTVPEKAKSPATKTVPEKASTDTTDQAPPVVETPQPKDQPAEKIEREVREQPPKPVDLEDEEL